MVSHRNSIKLKTDSKHISRNCMNPWRLDSSSLKDEWIKEEIKKVKNFLKLKEDLKLIQQYPSYENADLWSPMGLWTVAPERTGKEVVQFRTPVKLVIKNGRSLN